VLRGQEHLLNTVNHIALQEALGYPRPVYAHLPVILNPETREKLSKRDRDRKIRQRANEWFKSGKKSVEELATTAELDIERLRDWLASDKRQLDLSEQVLVMRVIGLRESDLPEIMVHDFRKTGYLPEVLNNFLGLLGWNPGGNREQMSISELVELFTLDGVGKSNAMFNRDKLLSFNKDACAALLKDSISPRLVLAFRDYLSLNPDSPLNAATDDQLARLLKMKEGFRVLREVDELSRFLFVPDEQIVYEPDAIEKVLKKQDGQGMQALRELRPILAQLSEWTAHVLDEAVKQYAESKQLGLGKVAQPLRVAVTGTTVSPPIFDSLEMLGREHTLARIDRCLATI
jgi:glutamyl-tRNA synthetase